MHNWKNGHASKRFRVGVVLAVPSALAVVVLPALLHNDGGRVLHRAFVHGAAEQVVRSGRRPLPQQRSFVPVVRRQRCRNGAPARRSVSTNLRAQDAPTSEQVDERPIVESPDATVFTRMRKPDLKALMKQNGLDTTGTKPDLVRRLLDNNIAPTSASLAAVAVLGVAGAVANTKQAIDDVPVGHDADVEEQARWQLETVILPEFAKTRFANAQSTDAYEDAVSDNFYSATVDTDGLFGMARDALDDDPRGSGLPVEELLRLPEGFKEELASLRFMQKSSPDEAWSSRSQSSSSTSLTRVPLATLKGGQELRGLVIDRKDFGAFVDVGAEVDGLVHISKLTGENKGIVKDVRDIVNLYQEVTVWASGIDAAGQLHLSMNPDKKFLAPREDDSVASQRISDIGPDRWLRGVVEGPGPAKREVFVWVEPPGGGAPVMGYIGRKETTRRKAKRVGRSNSVKYRKIGSFSNGEEVSVRVLGIDSKGKAVLSMQPPNEKDEARIAGLKKARELAV